MTELEFFAGELHGYRSWKADVTEDGVRLVTEFREQGVWVAGKQPKAVHVGSFPKASEFVYLASKQGYDMRACSEHDAPGTGCSCGYYGYYNPNGSHHNLKQTDRNFRICGVIRGSGQVEMHEDGFRAEYAEILAVSPPRPERDHAEGSGWLPIINPGPPKVARPPLMQLLATYYGVPWFESFEEMVKELPPTHQPEKAKPAMVEDPDKWVAQALSRGLFQHYAKGGIISATNTAAWTFHLANTQSGQDPNDETDEAASPARDALAKKQADQASYIAMSKKDKKRRFPWLR